MKVKSQHRSLVHGAMFAAAAALAAGAASAQSPPIKLGAFFDLTGGGASAAEAGQFGTEIAVREINEKGVIGGRRIVTVVADTQTDATVGVGEMKRLVLQEKVDIIMGPVISQVVLASAPITKEGKVHFKGTAYFSDVNKLKAEGGGGGGGGGELSWTKQGDGMVLAMKSKNADDAAQPVPDAEVDKMLQQEKVQYQQMKPMMAAMFEGLKVEISARLPGKIAEANIFTQKDNTATLTITGKQMLAAMDKINGDDALLKAKIKAGKGKGEDDFMFEQMFGKKGPAQVKVTGATAPLFDYKAEVDKAKAGEAAMFKNLGVTPPAK